MKLLKRVLVVVLALALMIPATALAAETNSGAKKDVSTVAASTKTVTFDGKYHEAVVTVKDGDTTLKVGVDYVVEQAKVKFAGEYEVKVIGIGNYSGEKVITFNVKKASRKITVKSAKSVKAKAVKKASKKIKIVATAKGSKKFTYSSSSKKIKVSKNGVITVKKGTKKGTKAVITISTSASNNYKATTRKFVFTVK